MDYFKNFADITDDDLKYVGNKALLLAKTFQAGFPVPLGFVITSDVFF